MLAVKETPNTKVFREKHSPKLRYMFSQTWFVLNIVPRASLGMEMGGIDAENREESENRFTANLLDDLQKKNMHV